MNTMIQRLIYLLMTISLLLPSYHLTVYAFVQTDQIVVDEANLFTSDEKKTLQSTALEVSDSLQTEIILMTIQDAEGKSTQEYTDDYGDTHQLGYTDHDADYVIYCIDMDNRELYINTSGTAIAKLTDDEIYDIESDLKDLASNEEYYQCAIRFLEMLPEYLTNAQYDDTITGVYNPDTGIYAVTRVEKTFLQRVLKRENLIISLIIGIIISLIITLIMVFNNRSKMSVNSHTYCKSGYKVRRHSDKFLHTTVTKHHIDNHNSSNSGSGHSSVHTSSGGHSHGGGGMKF